jgi:Tfp pilus assembly protein PilF
LRYQQKHISIFIYVGIVVATLVAYEPIRYNSFVNYDDNRYVTENPTVIHAFTQPHFFMWLPLTSLSHILDCQLFGQNPLGHHLVSVAIHIVSALLLFWILKNITGTMWASAFVAAVFALHPLQVESVAWVAERKNVLSGLFWLLTTATYIHYARQPRLGRYLVVLLVFGLCIMTKPMVVTLPLALLLLDYWPLDRVRWGPDFAPRATPGRQSTAITNAFQKASAGRLILEKIPLLALSAFLSVMTFVAQQSGGAVPTLDKMPLDYRVANMFLSYIRYIGKMIWPSGLAVCYPHPHAVLSDMRVVTCAILLIVLTVVIVYHTGRRKKYAAVGWLWYIGTLVPMIGLVQAGGQAMANRYMYISMLGLLIIIGWAAKDFVASRPRMKIAAAILTAVLLSILVILTRIQVGHWQNSMTLYEYALKVTQNNALVENNYGSVLLEAGRLDEAILHLDKALSITPMRPSAEENLGRIYLKQKKADKAEACFRNAIKSNKTSAELYISLGTALGMQKKSDEALKCLKQALELEPNSSDIHNKLGIALLTTGKPDEAVTHFKLALQTSTIPEGAYINLGLAYNQLGQYELAIQNWKKALELKPNSEAALNNMAYVLAAVDNPSIHDANKAIELAQRACELTEYKEPAMLDTLAIAYAAAGKFDDAKATAEKALNIAKKMGRENLAIEIQNRIKLYQASQQYRQK